jgi:hypothetical protein
MLESLNKALAEWLDERLPDSDRLALIDLETGRVWRDLSGNRWFAFTDDGATLISFTD